MKGKKTGGRVAGSKNKVSQKLKEIFANICEDYYTSDTFKTDLQCLSERDSVAAAERLAAYVVSKSIENNVTMSGGGTTIEERLERLAKGESIPKDEE